MVNSFDDSRDALLQQPLPNSAETERAALGAVLLNNELIHELRELLTADDFYVRAYQFICHAMFVLSERGSQIDPLLLSEELRREGVLEQVGGMTFLSELTYGLPHYANVAEYAKIIKGHSLMRQLVKVANKATAEALEGEDEPDVILDHAEQMIFALRSGRRGRAGTGPRSYAQVWEAFCERQRAMAKGLYAPIPFFDLPKLNAMTGGGMYEQQLITVVAQTSRGKSSFVKQVMDFNAAQGIGSIYFSREMSELAIIARSLAPQTARDGEAAVSASLIRRAHALDEHRKARVNRAGQTLSHWPVWIETHTSNVADIYTCVRYWRARTYPDWLRGYYPLEWEQRLSQFIIIVDYAQLLKGSKARYGTKAEEFAEIWRTLKDMTQDLNARLLVVGQFNRTGYQAGQRPRLHQIEGSGEAEKATNVGIVLWSKEEEVARCLKEGLTRYPVGIYIDKQTEGPTGHIEAEYDTQTLEFYPPPAVSAGDFNQPG